MRFVKCMAGGIFGDIRVRVRVRYLCAVWEPGKITPLLLCICICNCICIVFVLYLWGHRCGVFAGSVGVGTIIAPAASPQIPILPSSSPLPSSLPNYLLNCPQHRRLATRAWNNALAKFSNLLTVSRSVWPIPFNSFHLPISVIVWFQQMCLKHIFCLKHNQLLSNFWNTTSRFDSQAIGCITRISNRSRSDCFAIGKTWTKIHKMTNDRWPITIAHQCRMLPSGSLRLRKRMNFQLLKGGRSSQKKWEISFSIEINNRLTGAGTCRPLTIAMCMLCPRVPVQHLCSTALCIALGSIHLSKPTEMSGCQWSQGAGKW